MKDAISASAIIPCWRCSHVIGRAVASVAAQTRPAREVILVDDASGDQTLDTLRLIQGSYPPGWVRVIALNQHSGPGIARNAAWDAATSDYIAFLDADDVWHPRKLEIHLAWLEANPEVILSGTESLVVTDGRIPDPQGKLQARPVSMRHLLISNPFPTRTVIVRSDIGLRFEDQMVTEDALLWGRILASGALCYVLNLPLSFAFREEFDPGGYSGDLWTTEKRVQCTLWRLYRETNLSAAAWLLSSAFEFLKYLRRGPIVASRRHRLRQSSASLAG